MAPAEARRRLLFLALLGVAFAAALVFGLWRLAAPPAGPVDVPWDRVPCARCRMLVSDPRFAAQLHEANGAVHFFDDPGCALLYRAESAGSGERLFFHDSQGSGWLAEDEVAFVPVPETPMAYGFAAVRLEAGEGLTPAQVDALLLAQPAAAEGP